MARPGGRKRLSPDERRAEIIRAADRVLEGRDPSSVTFEEIATEAGVSRALVYNYFGDRGGLLAALYSEVFADLDRTLEAALLEDLGPRERVYQVVQRYVTFARGHTGGWMALGTLAGAQLPAVQNARNERYDRLAAHWGGGDEARVVVAGLLGLLEAVVLDWMVRPALATQRIVELLEDLAWSGVQGLVEGGIVSVGSAI